MPVKIKRISAKGNLATKTFFPIFYNPLCTRLPSFMLTRWQTNNMEKRHVKHLLKLGFCFKYLYLLLLHWYSRWPGAYWNLFNENIGFDIKPLCMHHLNVICLRWSGNHQPKSSWSSTISQPENFMRSWCLATTLRHENYWWIILFHIGLQTCSFRTR